MTLGRLVTTLGLAALVFAGVLYLTFRDISRLQFFYFIGLDLASLFALHLGVKATIRLRGHKLLRTAVIVGGEARARLIAREFELRPWTGVQVIGYIDDQPHADFQLPYLGPIAETVRLVEEQGIDEVIFTIQNPERISAISLRLQQHPVMLHMIPTAVDLIFSRTPLDALGGVPLISLRESALSEPQWQLKRLFDICTSSLLLLLLSPILLLITVAIRLNSPGPIFFRQERIGQHGRRFKMIKFRSMYQDAERHWQEVTQRDEQGRLVHKQKDDPRITSIGRKLRRTSMDELPQLINVLRGDMSLVGPRPEMPYVAAEYEPWQWQRFRVPPGITGWWQVNGRSDRPMHLHTDDDLYYIQNYSFWLDLKILWKTVVVVFRGMGAY
jgi:exopolysaccharide biosynthesis polyprenyl glycosylphosphotransferase